MTTADTVFDTARRLQQVGVPYALVSVVKALAPASARPGDKAVVTADGELHGWVGGGCAQPAVVRTVRRALADGQARLIRIAPTALGHEVDLGDVLEVGMACHSGGTLELFVDPVLPPARLVVLGASPVAASLAQLAPRVGFSVTVVAEGAIVDAYPDAEQVIASDDPALVVPKVPPGAWVVVATQGRRDVQALRLALALQARQVSFVASARKAQVLKESLVAAGSPAEVVAEIVAPAGYPMAATTPEEIALSVLAAVVSHRRGLPTAAPARARPVDSPAVPQAFAACCGGEPAPARTHVEQLPAAQPVPARPEAGHHVPAAAATPSCCGGR